MIYVRTMSRLILVAIAFVATAALLTGALDLPHAYAVQEPRVFGIKSPVERATTGNRVEDRRADLIGRDSLI